MPEQMIQDDLNDQVRKWGIDIQRVELSAVKVLKQAENNSSTAIGSILKGLGMKDDPEYPTPQEFVRATHALPNETPAKSAAASDSNPAANHVSAMDCLLAPEIPEGKKFIVTSQIKLGPRILVRFKLFHNILTN